MIRSLLVIATLTQLVACGGAPGSAGKHVDADADAAPIPVATEAEALTVNALTRAEAKTVLKLVDDICGDTWCDGDYDFGFRRIVCSTASASCTLTLQAFPRDGVESAHRSYWRSCKTHDFRGFDSLVDTEPNGYQSLNQDYYDALTECIGRIESKL